MSKKKVFLLSNFGSDIPMFVKNYMNGDETSRWGKIINDLYRVAVRSNTVEAQNADILLYDDIPGIDRFWFKRKNLVCSIVDVDIDRPWCIESYDGSEHIQYLDYAPIDEKMNFHQLPKN